MGSEGRSGGWGSRGKRFFTGRVLDEAGTEGLTGVLVHLVLLAPLLARGGHTASSLCLKLSPSSFLKTEAGTLNGDSINLCTKAN